MTTYLYIMISPANCSWSQFMIQDLEMKCSEQDYVINHISFPPCQNKVAIWNPWGSLNSFMNTTWCYYEPKMVLLWSTHFIIYKKLKGFIKELFQKTAVGGASIGTAQRTLKGATCTFTFQSVLNVLFYLLYLQTTSNIIDLLTPEILFGFSLDVVNNWKHFTQRFLLDHVRAFSDHIISIQH